MVPFVFDDMHRYFLRKSKKFLMCCSPSQCCGSGMFIPGPRSRIPDPGPKRHWIPDPDPQQWIDKKLLKYFQPKIVGSQKYDRGRLSRIPDHDPWSRGRKSTGSAAVPLCTHEIFQLFSWPGLTGTGRIYIRRNDSVQCGSRTLNFVWDKCLCGWLQVSGELSNNGEPMRRFMQTFVLAPQSPKKYYVHNDIFRYQVL